MLDTVLAALAFGARAVLGLPVFAFGLLFERLEAVKLDSRFFSRILAKIRLLRGGAASLSFLSALETDAPVSCGVLPEECIIASKLEHGWTTCA